MRARSRVRGATLAAVATVAGLSWHYAVTAGALSAARASTQKGAAQMTASDSRHYLRIATELRDGDWSFAHVAPTGGPDLGHRQPLYPMLLAGVQSLGADGPVSWASLNIGLVVASMWLAYALGAGLFGSHLAGVAAAAALWRIPFLFDNAATRLLTEPGYVLWALGLGTAFMAYLARGRPVWLALAAVCGGLAYLQRVNGLLLVVAGLAWLFGYDLVRTWRGGAGDVPLPAVLRRHIGAAVLLLLVTTPSWGPRLVHAGDPLYHGYLPNYLWVDAYADAHVPGPPRYTWRDYAREHGPRDALDRLGYGLERALWEAPREKYGSVVALAMGVSVVIVLLARDTVVLSWLAVGVLQVLPIAWTALANPVRRIPATALLPFGIAALAAAVAIVVRKVVAARGQALAAAADARHTASTSERMPSSRQSPTISSR